MKIAGKKVKRMIIFRRKGNIETLCRPHLCLYPLQKQQALFMDQNEYLLLQPGEHIGQPVDTDEEDRCL